MIGRRLWLAAALGPALAGLPLRPTLAADRVFRVGILRPTAAAKVDPRAGGLERALVEQSRSEGRPLEIEIRYGDGQLDRLPALARELLQWRADLIIALGINAVRAAQTVTTTVPIVMFGNFDPVALGLVSSLARPGGNTTGVLITPQETLAAKKLELLREVLPGATRFALLAPDDTGFEPQRREIRKAAAALGLTLQVVDAPAGDYAAAFDTMVSGRAQAVLVGATTFFVRDRMPIIALALRHRLPTMWEWDFQVDDGGLMAYGSNSLDIYRRIAVYADRIFKGAKPGDLPVEQPAKVDLVINLKTAKAIGLSIPQSLLARADEVIQ
jgi:putative tryptophan/tyrosine transport system substrate-binding protein